MNSAGVSYRCRSRTLKKRAEQRSGSTFPSKHGTWQRSGKYASTKPSWKSMPCVVKLSWINVGATVVNCGTCSDSKRTSGRKRGRCTNSIMRAYQIMTVLKLGLANVGMWVRDQYFGERYQHCGWQRLLLFFQLGGWITTTTSEVRLELCAFNNRALVRDLEEVCRKVNNSGARLPDGRRLVVVVGECLRGPRDGPLALTG